MIAKSNKSNPRNFGSYETLNTFPISDHSTKNLIRKKKTHSLSTYTTGALRSVLLLSFCVVLHSSRSPFLSFFPGHLKGFPVGVQTSERYVNSTRTVPYYILEVNVSSLAEYTRPTEIISRTRAGILSSVLKRNPSKMLAAISPHQFHENSFVEELNLHRQRSRVDSTSIEKTKDADINGQ